MEISEFIADYSVHNSQRKRLLVRYRDKVDCQIKYVSIDDDDTFPQRKSSLHVPLPLKLIKYPKIIGSSHGLLCFYGCYQEEDVLSLYRRSAIVVLWNPSIRKSVVIKVADKLCFPYSTVFAFGGCPHANDPKLVKINYINPRKSESISCIPLQVEVFTLSSRVWRIPYRNLPRNSICIGWSHIVTDRFIYWVAYDWSLNDRSMFYYLVVSFDLTSEEFREIPLPDDLASPYTDDNVHMVDALSLSKLRDSLVVIDEKRRYVGVWMMEHGIPNSFTKLFTIDVPNASWINPVHGFRENGEVLLETRKKYKRSATLAIYEPYSKYMKDLGINGELHSAFMSSYVETLMLLDQADSINYSNMELI